MRTVRFHAGSHGVVLSRPSIAGGWYADYFQRILVCTHETIQLARCGISRPYARIQKVVQSRRATPQSPHIRTRHTLNLDCAKEHRMEDDASFGHWLTRRRQAMHVQRTELAARIGCAVVTLQKIETDERRPSRQIAERLAEHLSIPLHAREIFVRVAR